jgi:hypothetical protein
MNRLRNVLGLTMNSLVFGLLFGFLFGVVAQLAISGTAHAQSAAPDARVLDQAKAHKAPMLKTLEALVNIETGSRDIEGINQATELISARLKASGGEVSFVEAVEASVSR